MKRLWILVSILLLTAISLDAATYRVGPGRTYTSLQAVAPLLAPGDSVLVDGGQTYAGGIIFTQPATSGNRIVISGVRIGGNRPIISGGSDGVTFRTDYPYDGPGADHYTFEGFEVTGATNRGIYHQAKDLILRDVVVHNCMHGILGADQGSGSCLLENSEVYACGSGDRYHQIYMATDEVHNPGSIFRMQFCYIHDGAGGNNVKSRAERNEIYYNWIEGAYYHELELVGPDGGDGGNPRLKREDSDVVGNVLWKKTKPAGDTEFFNVTRIGGDGTGETHGRYRFVNNTILCGSRPVFRMFDSLESVEMSNNVFYRIDGAGVQIMRTVEALWTTGAEIIAGSNNWLQSGSTHVPSEWTASIIGSDPGLVDLANNKPQPTSTGPLRNAGAGTPASPPGYPFPLPAFPPQYVPPVRSLISVGAAATRISDGSIDIGAYEYDPATDVPDVGQPAGFILAQNYPNPFNPATEISFNLPVSGYATLIVRDLIGGEVTRLVDGTVPAGFHSVRFDAGPLASGMYFYTLTSGNRSMTGKMIFLR